MPDTSPVLSNRLSVAGRLWLAMALVIAALVGLLAFTGARASRTQHRSDALTSAMDAKQSAAAQWTALSATQFVRMQAVATSPDPAMEAAFKADIEGANTAIAQVKQTVSAMDLSDEDKAFMARIDADQLAVQAALQKIETLKSAANIGAVAVEVQRHFSPAVSTSLQTLRDFAKLQASTKLHIQADLAAERQNTLRIAFGVVFVVLSCLVGGTMLLIRSFQRPLNQAIGLAQSIADGDLSTRITVQSSDEFGLLLGALDKMAQRLRHIVGDVRHGVESVSTASAEIASGNQDLSNRTEQAAASLQQTANSMDELTGTVSNAAATARQANQLAASAAEAAMRGGAVVSQVVSNMDQITQSSRQINDIIGVIDGIAFQTNILALNAAVEAARAGEQGRGFAVVAGEVRTLAQRSAQAAKEIKSLINASVERVDSGAHLVAETGTAMQEIVGSVQRVTQMIEEIADAATAQHAGIADVNSAVTNLDQMTQQNAALVEQSAAAAMSLREQAGRLNEAVSVFKVA